MPVPVSLLRLPGTIVKRALTESTTVEVNEHWQPFTLPILTTPTTSLTTATATMAFVPSRCPNTQLQTILTDIARTVEALQVILQDLVPIDTAGIRVEVLNATRPNLCSFNLLIGLRQRLRRCESQVTKRRLSEGDAQELAYVRLRGVNFAVDAAGGGLDGQLIVLSRSRAVGGRMSRCKCYESKKR